MNLRESARDESCVACAANDGTVVLAHYFGPRRHDYGGGMSIKGDDIVAAFLCCRCHTRMDTEIRAAMDRDDNPDARWIASEIFLHYCALTWIRRFSDKPKLSKIFPRRVA
jgi:hypothetical protein